MNPRAELRDRLTRIAAATVPHLKVPGRIQYLARRISDESGLAVGAGTVKDWLYALDSDDRRVDSRHMDWARSRDRVLGVANDNRVMRPGNAEAVIGWAA
jgi:hypothetical protein